MPRRRYRMDKRAEAAERTRGRIVEACFALHVRQGISGTTMTQIAERAGVSVGTVYHHFPSYEDAVAACSAHAGAMMPPPDAGVLAGRVTLEERVGALVAAIFGYFEQLDAFALIRADRDRYEPIGRFVAAEEAGRLALTQAALEPFAVDERDIRVVAAMLDVAVHDGLRRAGFTTAEAAAEMATTICARLAQKQSAAPRRSTGAQHPSRGQQP